MSEPEQKPTTITIKLGQVVFEPGEGGLSFYAAFGRLKKQLLNATDAFQLAITDFRMVEEIKAYQQARLAAFTKHGKETEPGIWSANGESLLAVQAELSPLHEKPFVTTLPAKIKLTSEMKMTGEEIRLLLDLVEV